MTAPSPTAAHWAPERIWLLRDAEGDGDHCWCEDPDPAGDGTESIAYVREDKNLAPSPTADAEPHWRSATWEERARAAEKDRARLAAALRRAREALRLAMPWVSAYATDKPADEAQAALDAILAALEEEPADGDTER